MINVAVIGYGVVGSGVAEIIRKNCVSIGKKAGEEISVKKILDIRDFPDSPDKELLTKNSEEVFEDPSIGIVVETIGGTGIAYEYTKNALKSGKHVVTSNKELVATHGPELLKIAEENGVNYLFEASVGGGIPIIRPMNRCLAANEIHSVTGILNGTTNYILSQMKREGKDFEVALKEAQANGYAEADPTADIEGHDACRKIAILSSIAYNQFVDYRNIYTEGIKNISVSDMKYAESINCTIKLIAISKMLEGRIFARVSPAMIAKSHPLANVEDVFNAIVIEGDAIGEAMFYGRGAGKLPTASAVVADIIEIVKHWGSCGGYKWEVTNNNNVLDLMTTSSRFFVRFKVSDREKAKKEIQSVFGEVDFITDYTPRQQDEIAFICAKGTEKDHINNMETLKRSLALSGVINTIRILD